MLRAISLVVGGMLIGAGTATLVLKKRYERIADEEVASVKESFKDLKKQNLELLDQLVAEQPTPSANAPKVNHAYVSFAADKPLSEDDTLNLSAQDLVKDLGYNSPVFEQEDTHTGFKMYDRTTDNFNPADEDRSADEPYVISIAEFSNDEEDFDKITITYFEDDDTLVDERKETLGIENSVGQANLLRFGVGSENEDMVYIRNETLKIDFEVCRALGSYTETILGIPEWNAKDIAKPTPRVKKMRNHSD